MTEGRLTLAMIRSKLVYSGRSSQSAFWDFRMSLATHKLAGSFDGKDRVGRTVTGASWPADVWPAPDRYTGGLVSRGEIQVREQDVRVLNLRTRAASGQSAASYLHERLRSPLRLCGLAPGFVGSPVANPVSLSLLASVAGWCVASGIEQGDELVVDIPLPACAVAIIRNAQNGNCGHCVVPPVVRNFLKEFHAGRMPHLSIAPAEDESSAE